MKLFPKECVVGIFRGFSEGGMEFHADLVLPYRNDFQNSPMHGQFVLVQLENDNEAVLGRISALSSDGKLASTQGEDFSLRAITDDRAIPEDLREQYLKYRVDIRVLGVVRVVDGRFVFAPSHRRLPHVGSKVAFLSDEVLKAVVGHNDSGTELGFLAFGEYIYAGSDERLESIDWVQRKDPAITVKFDFRNLVSRRSFVFARAGFGKSNLTKLLFSGLYKETPQVERRGGGKANVGTVIFDVDGEYFFPDIKLRPGLADVPHLRDNLVVFTNKKAPSAFYGSFVAGGIKLDIRRFRPTDVISIALSPEKQDQQNVRKLKSLSDANWKELVDLIYKEGNQADLDRIKEFLYLESGQDAEALAARGNMTTVIKMLHDPSSQLIDLLLAALRDGKLCVLDVSQMRGQPALILSGLILQKIFDINQQEFVEAEPNNIPTIAVVEEAQAVLGGSTGEGPYVSWFKEGRKYDLGAFLITQQPGSISHELLSQGDNWFVFHLLSEGDLWSVKKANAHFSKDLLSSLLNEPIPGHVIFWSSVAGKAYPISLRVMSFEAMYEVLDPDSTGKAVETYASSLKARYEAKVKELQKDSDKPLEENQDLLEMQIRYAIGKVKESKVIQDIREGNGVPFYDVVRELEKYLDEDLGRERNTIAYYNVGRALNEILGEGVWDTELRPAVSTGKDRNWVVLKRG